MVMPSGSVGRSERTVVTSEPSGLKERMRPAVVEEGAEVSRT